ncbi:Gfo/Idh/MocA family protein [Lentzea sp. NBC_00516]|uniref:Gfo/Idh/MocA family protein n=1 Tax=Lentzea sp. NBC_00516 TaxID=2903582 RepID=UPI003FA555CE
MPNVGFIGAGFIASRHAAAVTAAGARIVAVHDVDHAKAFAFAECNRAIASNSLSDLLATESIDAVFVCVPPDAHGAVEQALVDRRVPFFVEKPLPPNLDMARAISASIDRAGLMTSVGYHWRHLDRLEDVRLMLAESPAHMAVAQWHDGFPTVPWWGCQARSGGQVVEQATHLIDLCRLLLGEVVGIRALSSRSVPTAGRATGADVASSSAALVEFATGSIAVLASSCTLPRRHTVALELICEGRAITLTEDVMTVVDGARTVRLMCDRDPFAAQAETFLRALEGGPSDSLVSYTDALLSHEVAVAIADTARGARKL